ncbi:MAG: Ldh family oxidoreductase [Methanoregula sp.]|jgi:ureidoglycolate dehydrogenase (NAD+)|nr:Ldh family oxidoreductase [Methanoregula sp.]
MKTLINIKHRVLLNFLDALFKKTGVSKSLYSHVINGLINSSLRGIDSHGIRLAPHYVRALLVGRINKEPKFIFDQKSLSAGVLDADHGFGISAGLKAIKYAVKMAKKTGVGVVAVKNSTHFGAAEIFSLAAAEKNMVGISFSNTDKLVIPFGGSASFLGTNPIAIAFPCLGGSLSLDMATSSVAWNKIMVCRAQNKKINPEWAVDEDANPVTDPKSAKWLTSFADIRDMGWVWWQGYSRRYLLACLLTTILRRCFR